MNTKRWLAIIAAVVLLFVSMGVRFTMSIASGMLESFAALDTVEFSEEVIRDGDFGERIAVLNIEGIIQDTDVSPLIMDSHGHAAFLQQLEQAAEDPTIAAVLLKVNNPGGAVGPTTEMHKKLIEMQEEY